jgi:tRNA (guanine-N7-)-methyltransferase
VNPQARPLRSYVLRQGRLSPAQRRAHETLLPRYGIAYRAEPLDLRAVFGRAAPKILEIGFGMGETTARLAQMHPECDYLGIEVHTPGIGSLLRRVDELKLTNVRIVPHDAAEVVRDMITDAALNGVHIFFPDPWPKKRHHKRRLLQAPFVRLLATRLAPGAYLHIATDWQDYAESILEVLKSEPLLENTTADFAPGPGSRPLTKFEARGRKLGHAVWDLVFLRRQGQ